MILFYPAHPTYTHTKNPDWLCQRIHARAAPVICLLITRSRAQPGCARREMTRRRETLGKAFPEFCFSSSGRACKPEVRNTRGPLPLGRTGLMTQSQSCPSPEARPCPPTPWPLSSLVTHFPKSQCGYSGCRSPGTGGSLNPETRNRQQGGHHTPKATRVSRH